MIYQNVHAHASQVQMGLQLTDNLLFWAKKPSVSLDYVCFYKKSAFFNALTSSEIDDMLLKIGEDHNCDTFYFAIFQSLTASSDMIQSFFRLE